MGAKEAVKTKVDEIHDSLIDLSHRIHWNPEIGYQEEKSSAWAADALEEGGLTVERGACALPTAFIARAGSGPLHVAI